MPVDPATAAAVGATITKTVTWLWEKYGPDVLEKVGKRAGEAAVDRVQWERGIEKYLTNLHDQVRWLRVIGKLEGQPIERIYTDINLLDQVTAERWYNIERLKKDHRPRLLNREKIERLSGLSLVQRHRRIYILGKPGAGKGALKCC